MKTFSYLVFSMTLLLAFCLWLPDGTVKLHRWDPLGSDINGLYDIE